MDIYLDFYLHPVFISAGILIISFLLFLFYWKNFKKDQYNNKKLYVVLGLASPLCIIFIIMIIDIIEYVNNN